MEISTEIFIIIKVVPKGPSEPRYADPTFLKAVVEGILRYKNGQNPENKRLKNKDLADLFKVSEAQISRLLKNGEHAPVLSALTLAMALKAGVSVAYDHLELSAKGSDPPQQDAQPRPANQQISFIFETGFVCENTADGLTVQRKGPTSSSTLWVQVKVV
jgi:hypothetical protein